MKIEEFNRTYASRKYQLEFRGSNQENYLRLLDYAAEKEITTFSFPDRTADLPEQFLEFVKTLPDGDLST